MSTLTSLASFSSESDDGLIWQPTKLDASASRSSLVDGPQRHSSDTPVGHPPNMENQNTDPTKHTSHAHDANQEWNPRESAQRVVYFFSHTLKPIDSTPMGYSFLGDSLRMKMIVKWMRFYRYYPKWNKRTDKTRRGELKKYLKLPRGFGQRLASAVINKFNSFEKAGLVVRPLEGASYADYSPATNVWLSPAWDGNIDAVPLNVEGDRRPTRSPSEIVPARRSAVDTLQQDGKRQRLTPRTHGNSGTDTVADDATITVEIPSSMYRLSKSKPTGMQHSAPGLSQGQTSHSNKTHATSCKQDDLTMNGPPIGSSGTTSPSIIAASVAAETHTQMPSNSSNGTPAVQSKLLPRQHKDGARATVDNVPLDHTPVTTTPAKKSADSNGLSKAPAHSQNTSSNELHVDFSVTDISKLGDLKEMEKTCIEGLTETVKKIATRKRTHTHLRQQYEALEQECKAPTKVLKNILHPRQALGLPGGDPAVGAAVSLPEARKTIARNKRLREIEDQKSALEKRIWQEEELLSNLEICKSMQKARLKQVQDEIVDQLKEKRKGEALLRRWDSVLHGFQSQKFQDHSVMEPEDNFQFVSNLIVFGGDDEDDDDDDDEGLNGDSMVANGTTGFLGSD